MAENMKAYVSLIPSAQGFGAKVSASVAPEIEKSGSRITGTLGKIFKRSAIGIGAAAGGLLGTALFKGFNRLSAIEQAEAKLKGLGNSTRRVDKIMGNALASVRGTAFGLDEAATVAASAVASGIKPGRQLEGTLKLVADAASISGSSMSEMGLIFNKVAATGKIQGEVIQQLGERGIPVLALLADQLKSTPAEVAKLASEGKIGFETFSAAMQAGLGGAALESGNTFAGALANVNAALGRIGAGLLGGIFPHLAPMFQGIQRALEPLEEHAAKFGEAIGSQIGPAVERLAPWLTQVVDDMLAFEFPNLDAASGTLESLSEAFDDLAEAFKSVDFSVLATALGETAANSISVFSVVIGFLADHVDTLAALMPTLVAGLAAYKVAQVAATVVTTAATVATKAAAAGQWLLNAALTANPIGLVVVAIGGLIAGLVLAYKRSETFRNVVNKAFSVVKTVIGAVVGWIGQYVPKIFGVVVKAVTGYLNAYRTVVVTVFNVARTAITTGVEAVKNFAGAVKERIETVVKWFSDLPGNIKGAFGNAKEMLKGIGERIVEGLLAGIRAVAGKVTQAVEDVVGKIPKKIRSLMGIASPSKVTMRLGEFIGEGLAVGVEKSRPKLVKALEKTFDTLKNRLSKLVDQFKSIRDTVADAFTGNLFEGVNTVDFIGNMFETRGRLQGLVQAFKKLTAQGYTPKFLTALFQSGNAGLIMDLANNPKRATEVQTLFDEIGQFSGQLGKAVAQNQLGSRVAEVREELKGVREDLRILRAVMERQGKEIGKELNRSSARAAQKSTVSLRRA